MFRKKPNHGLISILKGREQRRLAPYMLCIYVGAMFEKKLRDQLILTNANSIK